MELLFKREQKSGTTRGVKFKLWGKVELDEDETAIVKRYQFEHAVMIFVDQPNLFRNAIGTGIGAALLVFAVLFSFMDDAALVVAVLAGAGAGYWYFHEKRETIYVRDLLHGRHFTCDSVVELARKEAWLETITAYLRQVMESAKHWDGTARLTIEPLPKDEARQVILRGL